MSDQVKFSVAGTIGDKVVETAHIADDAITESEIAPNAVTGDKIGDRVINHTHIADDAVTTDQLANESVVTDNLTDGAVITDKLANASVTADKIAPDALVFNISQLPVVPLDKGGTGADNASDARRNLGLGSAATRNAGTAAGDVPVLGSSGKLADAVIPGGFVPAGTRMVFAQAAPPAGWTQDANYNDRVLRFVSGTGNGTGGSKSVAGGRVNTNTEGSHNHGGRTSSDSAWKNVREQQDQGPASRHGHTHNIHEDGTHTHSVVYNIKYRNVIAATKD